MTGRQVGDERARYGRKSWREQGGDLAETLLRHRLWIVGAAVILGIGAWFAILSRNVPVQRIAVGDCLYIPTDAAGDPTTTAPIGAEKDVEAALYAGAAQETACTASHGHEVSAIAQLGNGPLPPAPAYDPDASRTGLQADCVAGFAAFVGHPVEGSAYVVFAVVPTVDEFTAGQRITMCLVARADGQWLTAPARASGG